MLDHSEDEFPCFFSENIDISVILDNLIHQPIKLGLLHIYSIACDNHLECLFARAQTSCETDSRSCASQTNFDPRCTECWLIWSYNHITCSNQLTASSGSESLDRCNYREVGFSNKCHNSWTILESSEIFLLILGRKLLQIMPSREYWSLRLNDDSLRKIIHPLILRVHLFNRVIKFLQNRILQWIAFLRIIQGNIRNSVIADFLLDGIPVLSVETEIVQFL